MVLKTKISLPQPFLMKQLYDFPKGSTLDIMPKCFGISGNFIVKKNGKWFVKLYISLSKY